MSMTTVREQVTQLREVSLAQASPGCETPDVCKRERGVKHSAACLCNFHPGHALQFVATDRVWVVCVDCHVVADAIAVGHSVTPRGAL